MFMSASLDDCELTIVDRPAHLLRQFDTESISEVCRMVRDLQVRPSPDISRNLSPFSFRINLFPFSWSGFSLAGYDTWNSMKSEKQRELKQIPQPVRRPGRAKLLLRQALVATAFVSRGFPEAIAAAESAARMTA
jgi:hypothetical protein